MAVLSTRKELPVPRALLSSPGHWQLALDHLLLGFSFLHKPWYDMKSCSKGHKMDGEVQPGPWQQAEPFPQHSVGCAVFPGGGGKLWLGHPVLFPWHESAPGTLFFLQNAPLRSNCDTFLHNTV